MSQLLYHATPSEHRLSIAAGMHAGFFAWSDIDDAKSYG